MASRNTSSELNSFLARLILPALGVGFLFLLRSCFDGRSSSASVTYQPPSRVEPPRPEVVNVPRAQPSPAPVPRPQPPEELHNKAYQSGFDQFTIMVDTNADWEWYVIPGWTVSFESANNEAFEIVMNHGDPVSGYRVCFQNSEMIKKPSYYLESHTPDWTAPEFIGVGSEQVFKLTPPLLSHPVVKAVFKRAHGDWIFTQEPGQGTTVKMLEAPTDKPSSPAFVANRDFYCAAPNGGVLFRLTGAAGKQAGIRATKTMSLYYDHKKKTLYSLDLFWDRSEISFDDEPQTLEARSEGKTERNLTLFLRE